MRKFIALILALSVMLIPAGCSRIGPGDNDSDTDVGQSDSSTDGTGTPDGGGDKTDTNDTGDGTDTGAGQAGGALPILAAVPGPVGDALSGIDGFETELTYDAASELAAGTATAAVITLADAARLYNETDGQVLAAALLTSGGWVIAEQGEEITDIFSLAGRTVYAPEGFPEAKAVFEYIATEYGFELGDTLTVEVSGDAQSESPALLPSDLFGSSTQRAAIDLLAEWENVTGTDMWPGMCLAVRSDAGDTGALLREVESAMAPAEPCVGLSYVWVTGADNLRATLDEYLSLIYSLDPSIIGGYIPDDGFYK